MRTVAVLSGRGRSLDADDHVRLDLLGTSASVPSAERNHPALLMEAAGQRMLVDCGEGTQRQLYAAAPAFGGSTAYC